MREAVDREFVVGATRDEVWPRLLDVHAVASWLPIMHSVTEVSTGPSGIDGSSFQAAFEDKVGPFSLRADLHIEVAGVRDGEEVAIRARGEDRQIRSRIMIDAACALSDDGPGQTRVRLIGSYEITGRVATLGAGIIRSKATKLIDTFCTNATHGLTGTAG
ncbi:MAG: SRPBCC domain-containing protein [Acidimicrobiaceae bacterium]|nr:SRPBCC domain-containing protein [Acidimicrobiaceae bacterium]